MGLIKPLTGVVVQSRIFLASSSTIKEQVLTIAHADILVQTHGSALGNLMFLKEVHSQSAIAQHLCRCGVGDPQCIAEPAVMRLPEGT